MGVFTYFTEMEISNPGLTLIIIWAIILLASFGGFLAFDSGSSNVNDKIEQFGILDLRLPFDPKTANSPTAKMAIDNQVLKGYLLAPDTMQFLFCAKDAKQNSYTITSNVPALNGKKGAITSYLPPASNKNKPATDLPNWWTDDPSTNLIEMGYLGVKTLNPYREDFLGDFAKRLRRLDGIVSNSN